MSNYQPIFIVCVLLRLYFPTIEFFHYLHILSLIFLSLLWIFPRRIFNDAKNDDSSSEEDSVIINEEETSPEETTPEETTPEEEETLGEEELVMVAEINKLTLQLRKITEFMNGKTI